MRRRQAPLAEDPPPHQRGAATTAVEDTTGNAVGRDVVVQRLGTVRGRPDTVLSEQEILARTEAYVPVGNHDALRKTLELYRFVALAGPSGSGTETTAVALLGRLLPAARIHRFSTEQDDVEEAPHLKAGDGHIVRARDSEPSRLRSFLSAVRASRGFVVVVGTAEEHRGFAEFLAPITVEPPPAEEVYRSHLRHRHVHPRWPDWPRAGELLEGASPGDASRLAGLVAEISAEGGGEHEVEQAYLGWAEHLRAWFGAHREPVERAWAIAAAALGRADETLIHQSALSLAGRLGTAPEGGGSARTPVEMLDELREGECPVFSRRGYADSVLDHVCAENLLAHAELLDWLGDLPTAPFLDGENEHAHHLVRLFARLASRYDAPEHVTRKAYEWAGGEAREVDLAYIALSATCLDPAIGGRVRSTLYEWSRESRTPQPLKLTVARVCQVIGQTYPPVALTRLMHLATHGDAQVRGEAAAVAGELAEQDASAVFTTALRWVRSTCELASRPAESRLDTAMRVLLGLLPAFGRTGPRQVLEAVDHVVVQGHPHLRPHLLKHARTLAEEHPLPVLSFALDQAGAFDSPPPRQTFGTDLFLSLVASARPEDLSALLTDGVDPLDAVTAWAFALESPSSFPGFAEALSRWLDLAETRPDLIDPLYAAAWHSRPTRRLLTDLVARWSSGRPERRPVREALLVHILLPEWRRRLLTARIRLRGLRDPSPD